MNTLLLINASGRSTRSVTRALTGRFATAWAARHPGGEIISRDVGLNPPPPVNEAWIAAAFVDPAARTPAMREVLGPSDTLVDEIFRATEIVVGTPMYNFGMPAQLKAYVDQIVRVGRTFSFQPEAAEHYRPLIPTKPVVLITATGAGGFEPGGPMAHLNFLEPHIAAAFAFIGLADIACVRVGFEEVGGGPLQKALAEAERAIDGLVARG